MSGPQYQQITNETFRNIFHPKKVLKNGLPKDLKLLHAGDIKFQRRQKF